MGAKFELIENIPKITGASEFLVMGSFMHIEKDLQGYILIFFPEKSVRSLSLILSSEKRRDPIDTMNRPLMAEVSHILAGTYVTALSKFLDLNILISTSYTVYDMFGSILNSVLTEMNCKTDFALLLDGISYRRENLRKCFNFARSCFPGLSVQKN